MLAFSTQTLFVPKSASRQITYSSAGWKEPALPAWGLVIHVLPVLRVLIHRYLEPGLQSLLHPGNGAYVGRDLLGDNGEIGILLPQLEKVSELGCKVKARVLALGVDSCSQAWYHLETLT